MNAEIISVGSELLSGKQSNTNAVYLSEQLMHIGVEVTLQSTVGDRENDIKKVVSDALGRSNIVIITGGLGPTQDDITKEAVCNLLGIKLKVDEVSLEKIEKFFARKGEKMADNNIRQAQIPEGSVALKNEVGLAPGCILKSGNQCIIMMPGVPYEMQPMFENSVKPFLKTMTGYSTVSKTVNVFGMSESLIAEALDDLIEKKSPIVATYAGGGKTDIFVSSKAEDVKLAIRDVDSTVEEIQRRLGDVVYGVDEPSLQHTVVSQLVSEKITVATAESCTGGLLSKKLTDIAGSSLCFEFGAVSYSESAKNGVLGVHKETLQQFGAVSAETACQMAVGAMSRAGTDMGVSITGYAGPAAALGEPVGLVFIAVCNRETVWVKRFELSNGGKDSRDRIRELASLHALDMIRRVINGFAIFNSQRLPVSEVANSIESRKAAAGAVLFRNQQNAKTESDEASQQENDTVSFEKGLRGKLMKFLWMLVPNKLDDTGEKVRKSVFLTALVALIVSVCYILGFFLSIEQNKKLYNNLAELKTQKPTTSINYPEGYLEEFGLLYQENPDIAGWIEIGDTVLSYPVVQGVDNDYYLTHNFYGKKERHGVPFVDYRNNLKELDTNTILHGHNMKSDNQMFSELENYYKGNKPLGYYRKHPLITFDTVYEQSKWKIFAVFTCNVNTGNGEVFPYYDFINPADAKEFSKFVDDVRTMSKFNIPVDVEYGDRLLTLSTCYYDYDGQRLVIVARQVRDGESSKVDVNKAAYNKGENKYVPVESEETSSYNYNNIINNNSNYRPQSGSSSNSNSNSSSSKPTSSYDEDYWTTPDSSIPEAEQKEPSEEEDTTTSVPVVEETPEEPPSGDGNQGGADGGAQGGTDGGNQGGTDGGAPAQDNLNTSPAA
ncbi:MAG: competence/damage-inducible protein A [Oscillospiraceae bacterium]|nr:competence/damage-inducible protein A [Oscillospiraceae bacterium]